MAKLARLFGIVIIAAVGTGSPALSLGDELLIANVTVISGDQKVPLTGANVLIKDGRIITLSASSKSSEGQTIDGTGKFLIPGLIDSHVHLYHATGLKRRYTADFDRIYAGYLRQLPRSFLYFGFTSVIELNASPGANRSFDDAPVHPTLYQCGHGLVLNGGFMAMEFKPQEFRARFPHFLHDPYQDFPLADGIDPTKHTPEAVVRGLREDGAICIKLYYEEALWMPGGPPLFALPSVQIVRDVVKQAHMRGMPVLLHATTPTGHQFALDAGVDILAHGMWEWTGHSYAVETPPRDVQRVADAVSSSAVRVQPTLRTIQNTGSMFDPESLLDPRLSDALTPAHIRYLNGPAQNQRDAFLKLFGGRIAEGGNPEAVGRLLRRFNRRYENLIGDMWRKDAHLLFGTDTAVGGFGWGNAPGLNGMLEMQGWQAGGISLRAIFESATIRNAEAFGLAGEIGSVAPGLRADLLLLSASPLETLDAYDRIESVILNGRILQRESLSAKALRPN
jgi:imidazolonepropionase-like amidohydrolase